MREGWVEKKLGSVAEVNPESLGANTPDDFSFKYIDLSMVNAGVVQFPEADVRFGEASPRARRLVKSGDVIMSTVRPNLKGFGYLSSAPAKTVCSTGFAVLRFKDSATAQYVYQYLFSEFVDRQIDALVVGSNYPAINTNDVKALKIIYPEKTSERQRIAEILKAWDEAIERLRALHMRKERVLESLRASLLFGKLRIPGQKSNWATRRLAEVTKELTERNGKGTLGRDLVMGVTNTRGIVPMREQTIADDIKRYKRLPSRAFAYNPMRVNVGSIAMNEGCQEVLVSPDYVVFGCNDAELNADYLDHLRKTRWWEHYINSGGSGSVRQRTYYADLAAMKLPLPKLDEQNLIVGVLNTARADVMATKREIEALAKQKRGLMQKLLTGEWRVSC